jgi:hypothetical protein
VNLNTFPEQQTFGEFDSVGLSVIESIGSGLFVRMRMGIFSPDDASRMRLVVRIEIDEILLSSLV